MSDLVQKDLINQLNSAADWTFRDAELFRNARDRIEELERDNKALRAALRGNFTDYADTEDHKQRRIEALEAALRLLIDRDVITNSPSLGAAIVTGYDPPLALDDIQIARRALEGKP